MDHSFHRKTFINSSRFGPLRIEVNQSELLENYKTFITQQAQPSKITFCQVIFWIQGGHGNYFHKRFIFGSFIISVKKNFSNQFIHFIPIPKPIVYIV